MSEWRSKIAKHSIVWFWVSLCAALAIVAVGFVTSILWPQMVKFPYAAIIASIVGGGAGAVVIAQIRAMKESK